MKLVGISFLLFVDNIFVLSFYRTNIRYHGSTNDIKSAYDNKNGAPSAGAPKAFFKYFYVNTATGEKSGEKMASAVLSA